MKANEAPKKHSTPFGVNGPREDILADTPSGSNQASYDDGFPAITMTLKSAGGLPPKGQDMNQILFELSSLSRYMSAGGGYPFDAGFANSLSGYPRGAMIPNSTASGYWLNTVDDNSANPENTTAALSGWVPVGSYGVTSVSGLASSGVTLTTLQASKDKFILSGTLTANITIIVPAWIKTWQVVNNCTGPFVVTVKTPSGTGVAIPSGRNALIFGDGVNITTGVITGALLNVQVFTSSGTYTPTPGAKRIRVRLVGGGAGGGGTQATASNQIASSSGGGAGAYGDTGLIDATSITTVLVTVGTPGQSNSATSGGVGGLSSFGNYISAPGGIGGSVGTAGVPGTYGTVGDDTATTAGCTGSNVVISVPGRGGSGPINLGPSGNNIKPGAGGFGMFSGGGRAFIGTISRSESATGYGGGGSGISAGNSAVAFAGGNGSGGLVIVEEYS